MSKRKTTRFCIDCGSKLVYYPNLSNIKVNNECRLLTYACPSCTEDFEKPFLISVTKSYTNDPIRAVKLEIRKYKKKKF